MGRWLRRSRAVRSAYAWTTAFGDQLRMFRALRGLRSSRGTTSRTGASRMRSRCVRRRGAALHERAAAHDFDAHYFYVNAWASRRISRARRTCTSTSVSRWCSRPSSPRPGRLCSSITGRCWPASAVCRALPAICCVYRCATGASDPCPVFMWRSTSVSADTVSRSTPPGRARQRRSWSGRWRRAGTSSSPCRSAASAWSSMPMASTRVDDPRLFRVADPARVQRRRRPRNVRGERSLGCVQGRRVRVRLLLVTK